MPFSRATLEGMPTGAILALIVDANEVLVERAERLRAQVSSPQAPRADTCGYAGEPPPLTEKEIENLWSQYDGSTLSFDEFRHLHKNK